MRPDQDSTLTIVMYHYVRPLRDSRFPRLKALERDDFIEQLGYLSKNHTLISPQALRAALAGDETLPPRACLLSFDDGYADHFDHVFPALLDHGAAGLFFAPAMSLIDREMLKVNKIQFILANADDPDGLAGELDTLLAQHGDIDLAALREVHFTPNRFDTAGVSYVKRLLQHALPQPLRDRLVDRLFASHVTADETAFAEHLYLSVPQAREMEAHGMEFGAHGDRHLWHDRCTPAELSDEISGSLRALDAIGRPASQAFYCYPFGGVNDAVTAAARAAGFIGGFSVDPRVADLQLDDPMRLPRLDTNDLPKRADAAPNRPPHLSSGPSRA